MPIFFALAWITGSIFASTPRVSAMSRTPLHSLAEHMPFFSVSYFEPLRAARALTTLPREPCVWYGANSASWLFSSGSGVMWFATLPTTGLPQACTRLALSMAQFIARRTLTSSNGGWVKFMVRYHVRSPEFWKKYFLNAGFVEYLRSV